MSGLVLPIAFLLLRLTNGYKILIFAPATSRSHMISNGRIADVLSSAGHNVTLLEPDFQSIWSTVNNSKRANKMPIFGFTNAISATINKWSNDFADDSMYTSMQNGISFGIAANQNCDELLSKKDVLERLRVEKFDAIFAEMLNGCGHGLGLRELCAQTRHSCPLTDSIAWNLGIPHPIAYLPSVNGADFGTDPTFAQRLQNLMLYLTGVYSMGYYGHGEPLDAVFRKHFGDKFPTIASITRRSDVVFVAADEMIDFPRALPPNVVHIGGLGIEDKPETLSEEFEHQMSLGEDGVIFFSLGSNVDTAHLPPEAVTTLFKCFAEFPHIHFIAKINKNDTVTWPCTQNTRSGHKRLRLMIGHGGYNSLMEAALIGKPLIIMPFFFDQFRNGRVLEKNGWGISVKRTDLLKGGESLRAAIQEILSNNKYAERAASISRKLKNRPFTPEDRLIRWTEFAISSNGLAELQTPAGEVPLLIYHNVDIVAFVLLAMFALIYALISSAKIALRYCTTNKIKIE